MHKEERAVEWGGGERVRDRGKNEQTLQQLKSSSGLN